MKLFKGLPILLFTSGEQWQDWLQENHTQPTGVWLQFAKKHSGKTSITYDQAREAALMYGWIDGLASGIDESYHALRFTPRRTKSVWSKINRDIAEGLIAAGAMKPAGLAAVEAAKQDGRWDAAYAGQATMAVPGDLSAALAADPKAKAFFETLDKTNRYAFLWRVQTAAKPETRAARIQKLTAMLHDGKIFRIS